MGFTFGADPEFPIFLDGEPRSAIGHLPSRKNRERRPGKSEYYHDNVMAEIALLPGSSRDEVIENVRTAVLELGEILGDATFKAASSVSYPDDQLSGRGAKLAGCEPEWSAYSFSEIVPPKKYFKKKGGKYEFRGNVRSAGGHIHLGFDFRDDGERYRKLRMLDLFVGIPSVIMDPDPTSATRRKMYGAAGSHRLTPYGLEYRTPGNFWLSSPSLVGTMYDLCEFAMSEDCHDRFWHFDEAAFERDPASAYTCFGYDLGVLKAAIGCCDRIVASKMMELIGRFMPKQLADRIRETGESGESLVQEWEGSRR